MAKNKVVFLCNACGAEFPKWAGQCSSCKSWNSLVEVDGAAAAGSPGKKNTSKPVALSSITGDDVARIKTSIEEFNLVCGGGIVPGAVTLIGGEPGIGKSTLALQIAHQFKTLYVSGEESPSQIRHRADRLGIDGKRILISTDIEVGNIIHLIEHEKPECVFVDSIQTLNVAELSGFAGTVTQIRESAARLTECAKRTGIPLFIIGHITKDGSIAGPKVMEHIVDTVLYFEGDFARDFRLLRSFKNRFGSVNEVGLFRMTESGLEEVKDKNSIFLNPYQSVSAGNAVSAALEGSRVILFEVQSLVTFTAFSNPRRMADGFDLNRLVLLCAVLEKHAGLKLSTFDVFINVAGGFRISETSADLALAIAVASSLKEKPAPQHTAFLGEISLSGEIRPVPQAARRIQECIRSGFTALVLTKSDAEDAKKLKFSGELIVVHTIREAIDRLFK